MKEHTNEQLKDYSLLKFFWFSISALSMALFIGGEIGGFSQLSGIASSVLVLLSLPINFLFGWLFFAFDFNSEIITFFLLATCTVAGYIQWFILLPKLINFIKNNLRKTYTDDEAKSLNSKKAFQLNPASVSYNFEQEWLNKDQHSNLVENKIN